MSPDTAQPVPSVRPESVEPKPAVAREGEPPSDKQAPASPPAPAPDAAPVAPPAPQASPMSTLARSRLRRVLTVGGTLLFLFIAWEVITYFVAYTDDAYVRSDLVAVAPEITGPIISVHVHDNQPVKRGDPLFTIDPVPFRLVVDQKRAEIEEAKAQIVADA